MTPEEHQRLRDERTYYVSDERLAAFGKLSYEERLRWVEECSHFVRLAQAALKSTNKTK